MRVFSEVHSTMGEDHGPAVAADEALADRLMGLLAASLIHYDQVEQKRESGIAVAHFRSASDSALLSTTVANAVYALIDADQKPHHASRSHTHTHTLHTLTHT